MGKHDAALELFDSQLRRVQTLAKAHKVINHDDVGVGLSNFAAIAKFLCKAHGEKLRKRELDNRVAWTKVLHGRVPQRYVCGVVRQLVEWYISVTALTGGVERSLGRLVKTLEAHQGRCQKTRISFRHCSMWTWTDPNTRRILPIMVRTQTQRRQWYRLYRMFSEAMSAVDYVSRRSRGAVRPCGVGSMGGGLVSTRMVTPWPSVHRPKIQTQLQPYVRCTHFAL